MTARGAGRAVRTVAALILALAALLPVAALRPALAAEVTFGTPEATATYGEAITFTVPMTSSGPLERLEIRLTYPGSRGPFVEEVPVVDGGTQTYRLDLAGSGHLVPNTPVEAVWAAVPADGGEPVLSRPVSIRYTDTAHDWRSLEGNLVRVHWYEGDEAFARRALEIGDEAVRKTAELLGVTETEPIDFFIYGDQASFRAALGPGTRENVGGQAHPDIRTLFGLITPGEIDDAWVGIVIPHELVHLVFDTAVENPFRYPPRWVNEGLAVYLSEGYTPGDRNLVADAAAGGELLPLSALIGQFPTDPEKTYLAYAMSVSAIAHLVDAHGEDALWALVAAYADGLTDDEAFTRATGTDVAGFQAGWLEALGAGEPQAWGPQPYEPGPVPPGWDAPVDGAPSASPGTPGAPTSAPGTTPGPAAPGPGPEAGRTDGAQVPLLLGAIALVVVVVVIGMVVARRRTAGP